MSENGSTQKNAEAISFKVAPTRARREGPHASNVSNTSQSMSSENPQNQPMQEIAPDQSTKWPLAQPEWQDASKYVSQ